VLPDIAINFDTPVYATSFLFAAPGSADGISPNVEVDIYSGAKKIDSINFRTWLSSGAYVVISENQSFTEVVLTELSGVTNASTFNAIVGDVQAVTVAPEPGTIGLLGLGLAGVGYFARRRKA
jgi:hypothetical protein